MSENSTLINIVRYFAMYFSSCPKPKNLKSSISAGFGNPYLIVFLIVSSWFYSASAAQASDSQLIDFLNNNCGSETRSDNTAEFEDLCSSLGWVQGSGGGANTASVINSAQSFSALSASQNTKITIDERLEKLKRCRNIKDLKKGSPEEKECEELKIGASADELVSNLGFFFSGMYNEKDRKQVREMGFRSELEGFVGGFDYRFTDWITAGFAVGHSTEDSDFYDNAGNLNTESWNYTLYSTITPLDNMYIDLYASYSDVDHKSRRNFAVTSPGGSPTLSSGTAFGNNEADLYMAGFTAGYSWNWNGFSIDPRIKFDYSWIDIESYQETTNGVALNLQFPEQHRRSLTTSFGSQLAYAQSFPWGVLIPQARAYYVHEYKNDAQTLTNSLAVAPGSFFTNVTDDPDRDYMVWGGGISTILPHGVQLFADFEQVTAHRYLSSWTATGGLRLEF